MTTSIPRQLTSGDESEDSDVDWLDIGDHLDIDDILRTANISTNLLSTLSIDMPRAAPHTSWTPPEASGLQNSEPLPRAPLATALASPSPEGDRARKEVVTRLSRRASSSIRPPSTPASPSTPSRQTPRAAPRFASSYTGAPERQRSDELSNDQLSDANTTWDSPGSADEKMGAMDSLVPRAAKDRSMSAPQTRPVMIGLVPAFLV